MRSEQSPPAAACFDFGTLGPVLKALKVPRQSPVPPCRSPIFGELWKKGEESKEVQKRELTWKSWSGAVNVKAVKPAATC